MGRSKKNVLNQVVEEPKIKVNINKEINIIPEFLEDEIVSKETESPVYEDDSKEDGEKEEEIIEKSEPRTFESLSHKEFRHFQRTGQMPK